MAGEEFIKEVSEREGYAYWAASYDQENNALIAVEDAYVYPMLAQLPSKRVLEGYLSKDLLDGHEEQLLDLIILGQKWGPLLP